jgi:RNA polymerase sigma-70 factor (ECF subfamily)
MSDARGVASAESRFTTLFEATYRDVRCFTVRRLPNPSVVDDIVSETFFTAWRRLAQVPADQGGALTWLCRVAEYGVTHARLGERRRHALRERLRNAVPAVRHNGERVVVLHDEQETLADAFAALPDEDRTILLLAAWQGLSSQALGMVIGCSAGAAATRLARARARLSGALLAERLGTGVLHGAGSS